MTEPAIITAAEVCKLLRLSTRTLERRHTWRPAFPAPLTRKPLTWLRSRVEAWIIKRDEIAQREAA